VVVDRVVVDESYMQTYIIYLIMQLSPPLPFTVGMLAVCAVDSNDAARMCVAQCVRG